MYLQDNNSFLFFRFYRYRELILVLFTIYNPIYQNKKILYKVDKMLIYYVNSYKQYKSACRFKIVCKISIGTPAR